MPLHDWDKHGNWDGVHHLWIVELLRWIKPRLPEGFRAYIGTVPAMLIGAGEERPDVQVRQWEKATTPPANSNGAETPEPDEEIAVATLDPSMAVYVESGNCMVAAVELISPRNKDRPSARAAYLYRYTSYLMQGVHLVLVDVHRHPLGFSFADGIAQELGFAQPRLPTPHAVGYRVGEPAATGGRLLAIWRHSLAAGTALPALPLPLAVGREVLLDLEGTYSRAAADAYLT